MSGSVYLLDRASLISELTSVLEIANDSFDDFLHISISFGNLSKPVRIINSKRNLSTFNNHFILSYAADKRRKQDKEVINALEKSTVFDDFNTSTFGYDGIEWSKPFNRNSTNELAFTINAILLILEGVNINKFELTFS